MEGKHTKDKNESNRITCREKTGSCSAWRRSWTRIKTNIERGDARQTSLLTNQRWDEVELAARQNAGDALAGRSETVDGGENESAVDD